MHRHTDGARKYIYWPIGQSLLGFDNNFDLRWSRIVIGKRTDLLILTYTKLYGGVNTTKHKKRLHRTPSKDDSSKLSQRMFDRWRRKWGKSMCLAASVSSAVLCIRCFVRNNKRLSVERAGRKLVKRNTERSIFQFIIHLHKLLQHFQDMEYGVINENTLVLT